MASDLILTHPYHQFLLTIANLTGSNQLPLLIQVGPWHLSHLQWLLTSLTAFRTTSTLQSVLRSYKMQILSRYTYGLKSFDGLPSSLIQFQVLYNLASCGSFKLMLLELVVVRQRICSFCSFVPLYSLFAPEYSSCTFPPANSYSSLNSQFASPPLLWSSLITLKNNDHCLHGIPSIPSLYLYNNFN